MPDAKPVQGGEPHGQERGHFPNPPLPPLDHAGDGFARLRQWRARPTWFGLIIIEQLCEGHDGEKRWQKIRWPMPIAMKGVE